MSEEEREIIARLEAMLEVTRALAHERVDALDTPDALIEPFAVAWTGGEQRLLDLADVAHVLATPTASIGSPPRSSPATPPTRSRSSLSPTPRRAATPSTLRPARSSA